MTFERTAEVNIGFWYSNKLCRRVKLTAKIKQRRLIWYEVELQTGAADWGKTNPEESIHG